MALAFVQYMICHLNINVNLTNYINQTIYGYNIKVKIILNKFQI